jgi:hypothetical protein
MAERELEAGRLAAGFLAQAGDEFEQAERRRETRCARPATRNPRRSARRASARSRADLRRRQHAAVARLGACESLISIILTCGEVAFSTKRSR